MKRVLILGANGQIAKEAIKLFLEDSNIKLSLYFRKSSRLKCLENNSRICIIEEDVLDINNLESIMKKQDIVYANLSGNLENHAENILKSMKNLDLGMLIFISSIGIYDEVESILKPYGNFVKII